MKTVPAGFEEQNGGWKWPWDRNLFLRLSEFLAVHLGSSCCKPTSRLDFFHAGCTVLEAGQSRTQGPGPWEFPGLSQAWESSGLRAELHCDPTDNTHLLVPLHPQGSGSLSVSRAPAHPSNKGFLLLKGSRTLLCSDPD